MEQALSCFTLGVDVGADKLSCQLLRFIPSHVLSPSKKVAKRTFDNNPSGHRELIKWLKKHWSTQPLLVVMEATGCYYERLAYQLHDEGIDCVVLLPKKAKYFAKGSNIKTKTDIVDAQMLAQLGVEKFSTLVRWNPPRAVFRTLRKLTRLRLRLVKDRTRIKNNLHAEKKSYDPISLIINSLENMISLLDKEVQQVEYEIEDVCKSDEELNVRIKKVCTIPGVAIVTAAAVIAETFGFEHFQNNRQLVSYAGYDVVEKSSGDIKGKTKISKCGNSKIRASLYFPAFTIVQHDNGFEKIYERIFKRNPKVKMIGYVAIQRKLLVLIRTLYVKNEPYNPNFIHESQCKNEKRGKVKKVGRPKPAYTA